MLRDRPYKPELARAGDPVPFERQHQALAAHKKNHLDYALYLLQREATEKKWPDYDVARDDCLKTLGILATIERALGEEKTRDWLNRGLAHAAQVLGDREGAAS